MFFLLWCGCIFPLLGHVRHGQLCCVLCLHVLDFSDAFKIANWLIHVWLWNLLNCMCQWLFEWCDYGWFFYFFIISAVPKCIEHEVVIIDGMVLFIYMMSIANVTVLWRSYSLVGMLSNVLICNLDGVVLVVSILVILGWVQVFILHYIYPPWW